MHTPWIYKGNKITYIHIHIQWKTWSLIIRAKNAKQPTASENTTMIPGLQQNRPQSQLAAYGTCTKLYGIIIYLHHKIWSRYVVEVCKIYHLKLIISVKQI